MEKNVIKIVSSLVVWISLFLFMAFSDLQQEIENSHDVSDFLDIAVLLAMPIIAWILSLPFVFLTMGRLLGLVKYFCIGAAIGLLALFPFSSRVDFVDVFSWKAYAATALSVYVPFLPLLNSPLGQESGLIVTLAGVVLTAVNLTVAALQFSFLGFMLGQVRTARANGTEFGEIDLAVSADRAWAIFTKPYVFLANAMSRVQAYLRDDDDFGQVRHEVSGSPSSGQQAHGDRPSTRGNDDVGSSAPDPHQIDRCLQILGLEWAASSLEIKQAYRRLRQETHPDRNLDDPEATARFIQVTEAFQVLEQARRV